MNAKKEKVEAPVLESYTLVRDGEHYRVVTLRTQGTKILSQELGQSYWKVEATRKLRIAIGRLLANPPRLTKE